MELLKLRKQKDGEIMKLRNNLRKCQNELTEAIHCLANSAQHHGLSGAGNGSNVIAIKHVYFHLYAFFNVNGLYHGNN